METGFLVEEMHLVRDWRLRRELEAVPFLLVLTCAQSLAMVFDYLLFGLLCAEIKCKWVSVRVAKSR